MLLRFPLADEDAKLTSPKPWPWQVPSKDDERFLEITFGTSVRCHLMHPSRAGLLKPSRLASVRGVMVHVRYISFGRQTKGRKSSAG